VGAFCCDDQHITTYRAVVRVLTTGTITVRGIRWLLSSLTVADLLRAQSGGHIRQRKPPLPRLAGSGAFLFVRDHVSQWARKKHTQNHPLAGFSETWRENLNAKRYDKTAGSSPCHKGRAGSLRTTPDKLLTTANSNGPSPMAPVVVAMSS
jgi:hypothetical protein